MSVGAVGAIGTLSSGQSVYSVLNPYLNGVVRTTTAAQIAQLDSVEQAKSPAVAQAAIAANGNAAAAATASSPFANPAITSIGVSYALGQALGPTIGATPDALLSAEALHGAAASPFGVSNLTTFNSFNDVTPRVPNPSTDTTSALNSNSTNRNSTLNANLALNGLSTVNSINTFTTIDSTNGIDSLNTLQSAGTSKSLTNAPALNTDMPASINDMTTAQLNSAAALQQQSSIAALNAQNVSATGLLAGDAGTLVQSYGAVALITSPVAALQASQLAQAARPIIPPPAIVSAAAAVAKVV